MADRDRPSLEVARKALPPPLLEAIGHVFRQKLSGCWLVGGTALAGFYAGHRRSDDIDLFVRDEDSHRAASLAVESLASLGAKIEILQRSAQYSKALCRLRGHDFTADVALHPGLFRVGRALPVADGILVADVETLAMLKMAALVSRCGEKDLYDVAWLMRRRPDLSLEQLVELGLRIDAGATPEGLLIAVSGARLDSRSCGFALRRGAKAQAVYEEVAAFRRSLIKSLTRLCRKQPAPPIAALVKKVRRLKG